MSDDSAVHLGFKRITPENFAVPDISRAFAKDQEAWIAWFSEVRLSEQVPEAIHRLFEVARGAVLYGWFYYPLLTVGHEQCFRLLEAAARAAESLTRSPAVTSAGAGDPYFQVIKRLLDAGLISTADSGRWDLARKIRNYGAHPTTPTILAPGPVRADLRLIADQINELFSRVASQK